MATATASASITAALAAPSGVIPNFVDPPSHLVWYIVITSVLLPVVTAAVVLRMVSKVFITKMVGPDDIMCLLAWALYVPFCIMIIRSDNAGRGRYMYDLPITVYWEGLAVENRLAIIYAIATLFAKLSVLLLYIKLFFPTRQGLLYQSIVALIWGLAVLFSIAVFILIGQCRPREKIWRPDIPGYCVNYPVMCIAAGLTNMATDFIILGFPIFAVWHLQMPIKRKAEVMALFATGGVALVVSTIRFAYYIQLYNVQDNTWKMGDVYSLGLAELGILILCGCLPQLPKLIRSVFQPQSFRLRVSDVVPEAEAGIFDGVGKSKRANIRGIYSLPTLHSRDEERGKSWSDATLSPSSAANASTLRGIYEERIIKAAKQPGQDEIHEVNLPTEQHH